MRSDVTDNIRHLTKTATVRRPSLRPRRRFLRVADVTVTSLNRHAAGRATRAYEQSLCIFPSFSPALTYAVRLPIRLRAGGRGARHGACCHCHTSYDASTMGTSCGRSPSGCGLPLLVFICGDGYRYSEQPEFGAKFMAHWLHLRGLVVVWAPQRARCTATEL